MNWAIVAVGATPGVWSGESRGQHLYWSEAAAAPIHHANLSAGTRDIFFPVSSDEVFVGLAVDEPGRNLYWIGIPAAGEGPVRLHRQAIEGGPHFASVLVASPEAPVYREVPQIRALALDLVGELSGGAPRLYYAGEEEIYTTDPDGGDFMLRFNTFNDDPIVHNLALDFTARRLYWSSGAS